jgi:type II secretory pathway component PulF
MVRIGEEAGRLEEVLEKAALAYEHELEIEL